MQDNLQVTGQVQLVLKDINGNIKQQEVCNLVVTAGKTLIASRLAGTASNVISYLAVGTNNTAPAAGDTTLNTELFRKALSVAGGTPSTNTVQYSVTLVAGEGTGTLVEAGLFNANTAGTMLARTVFSAIVKGASDSLAITWTVTIN